MDRKLLRLRNLLGCSVLIVTAWASGAQVALVTDSGLAGPARHGLASVEAALQARGARTDHADTVATARGDHLIIAGLCRGGGAAAALIQVENIPLPRMSESLVIRRTKVKDAPAVLLCGSDARGLMYAAFDVADRVRWSQEGEDIFTHVRDAVEQPYISERAVSIYTMQRAWFERRLYDEAYWRKYFAMLARSRINSFVVIFGYENGGFLAPPYPYFFHVEGFPDVELVGITPAEQRRNIEAFRRLIRLAHDYGLDFTAGIWDHIYRGGVQAGGIAGASELAGQKVPGLVSGLSANNLIPYTKAALKKFIETFPAIDGLQFRMHGESGLKRSEMPGLWHEVFTMIKQLRPNMRIDLRAKQLPDSIIEDAVKQGLRVRIATKYWMEQMGLPFHPTHVNRQNQHDRRHGYADLLRYPQTYRVHWRLWNGGTTRLLLWADPEYVKRFASSAKLYGGDSFEVNEMLATWMLAEPHDRPPMEVLNPAYRYYDYEFERYWHYYQVWGRVSYNPRTPAEVWEREFERRFGRAGGVHLMKGLHVASRVLPRIVAAAYRYRLFPTTRGWAEMTRMDELPKYADDEEPTDIQQFLNVREAAHGILEGTVTARRRPEEISRWFAVSSRRILSHVRAAIRAARDPGDNEFVSTVTDLRILAYLAAYHSERLLAGVDYNLYKETGDLFACDAAIDHESRAVEAWRRIVDSAGDVYSAELAFGVHDKGFPHHWKEELAKLEQGLEKLKAERRRTRARGETAAPHIAHVPVRRAGVEESIRIRATVGPAGEPIEVRVGYAGPGGAERSLAMRPVADGMYEGIIPPAGTETVIRYRIEATSTSGARAVYPPGQSKSIAVIITDDQRPPAVRLEHVRGCRPGEDLTVRAAVDDPSGIRSVRLRYRHLTQFEDYATLEMRRDPSTGLYEATIPGTFLVPEWDLMYFVEAVDTKGNGRMYPDLEKEMPYVIVKLQRREEDKPIQQQTKRNASQSRALRIRAAAPSLPGRLIRARPVSK